MASPTLRPLTPCGDSSAPGVAGSVQAGLRDCLFARTGQEEQLLVVGMVFLSFPVISCGPQIFFIYFFFSRLGREVIQR